MQGSEMKSLQLIQEYAEKISDIEFKDISSSELDGIEKIIGIYFFKNIDTGNVDYVGTATGKKGLFQRVRNQHLNPKYLESVFRVKLSDELGLHFGDESVRHIRENYRIGILYIKEHISIIMALEQIFIYELQPKFNSEIVKHNKANATDEKNSTAD